MISKVEENFDKNSASLPRYLCEIPPAHFFYWLLNSFHQNRLRQRTIFSQPPHLFLTNVFCKFQCSCKTTTTVSHLEWVFLGREESLIVSPPLDQGEPARLPRRVGKCVHHVLKQRRIFSPSGSDFFLNKDVLWISGPTLFLYWPVSILWSLGGLFTCHVPISRWCLLVPVLWELTRRWLGKKGDV